MMQRSPNPAPVREIWLMTARGYIGYSAATLQSMTIFSQEFNISVRTLAVGSRAQVLAMPESGLPVIVGCAHAEQLGDAVMLLWSSVKWKVVMNKKKKPIYNFH
eukprot:TRINITY_DN4525_c0_g1_i1.p2 TRINITY_DN4525_c0_g1~~TRINITY_DN4525_c0_g1_i1.p2  ORF type:complete len:104 (+),score=8.40 TRINITY_DN4525_c0_g1_i1:257-568(+)